MCTSESVKSQSFFVLSWNKISHNGDKWCSHFCSQVHPALRRFCPVQRSDLLKSSHFTLTLFRYICFCCFKRHVNDVNGARERERIHGPVNFFGEEALGDWIRNCFTHTNKVIQQLSKSILLLYQAKCTA